MPPFPRILDRNVRTRLTLPSALTEAVSHTLEKLGTARAEVISLMNGSAFKVTLSSGMQLQGQTRYFSVKCWVLQKLNALAWMMAHGKVVRAEDLADFSSAGPIAFWFY